MTVPPALPAARPPHRVDVVADDGVRLALHLTHPPRPGGPPPLLCLPGGPMLSSRYLDALSGDDVLGGLAPLALLDPRGTGDSERPADPTSCRCDRQVADVEAVRRHLGLQRLGLLAHSAGANLAVRYLEHHPDRVGRLVLLTPSVFALGIEVPADVRRRVVAGREGDGPWWAAARAAFEALQEGPPTPEDLRAIAPLSHGDWSEATRAYAAGMDAERDAVFDLVDAFVAPGALDPAATRRGLADLDVPVLVVAGDRDVAAPAEVMAEVARLTRAALVVLPGAGHFPWRDDPAGLRAAVSDVLAR